MLTEEADPGHPEPRGLGTVAMAAPGGSGRWWERSPFRSKVSPSTTDEPNK